PSGVAVDRGGNVYVADTSNSTLRKITAAGVVTTLAGAAGHPGGVDGTRAVARLDYPTGVAGERARHVSAAATHHRTTPPLTPVGEVTTLAGTARMPDSTDGTGAAGFRHPSGVTVDTAGNVYVADTGNATIRRITPKGAVTTVAGIQGLKGIRLGPVPRFASP